jgi:hypothetical protein
MKRGRSRTPGAASLGLVDFSPVDVTGSPNKPVNFGAGNSLGSPEFISPMDPDRARDQAMRERRFGPPM